MSFVKKFFDMVFGKNVKWVVIPILVVVLLAVILLVAGGSTTWAPFAYPIN